MKHTQSQPLRLLALAAIAGSHLPLQASDPIEVPWSRVCQVSAGRELVLTTDKGEIVEGSCVAVDVNAISVSTKNHKVHRIARNALSRLEMHSVKGHQIRALGSGMNKALGDEVNLLLSPMAPVGLVAVPGTLAWGAVAAPFCVLGDLRAKIAGRREIKTK